VPPPERPIGYWLKRTDELLTERLGDVFAGDGLTRVHWQVLNVPAQARGTRSSR
jgi:hypothetical protein